MNQKVMRTHFAKPGYVNSGDIIQCPACRWKFVVLPDTIRYGDYWDAQTQGPQPPGWKDEPDYIVCPECQRQTDLTYYQELSLTGGIELTNWGKPEPKKEKPNGKKRSRKSISK